MTPREQLAIAAWETRRMVAALLTGDPDGEVPPLGRPVAGGLLIAALIVAGLLLGRGG